MKGPYLHPAPQIFTGHPPVLVRFYGADIPFKEGRLPSYAEVLGKPQFRVSLEAGPLGDSRKAKASGRRY